MEGEKDDCNCIELILDTVVDGDLTIPENDIENDSQPGDKVSVNREENMSLITIRQQLSRQMSLNMSVIVTRV
jgi:hypothetical protein